MNFYRIVISKRSCPDCPWEHACQMKSVALTVLELLAFNAQKIRGSRDPGPELDIDWIHPRIGLDWVRSIL